MTAESVLQNVSDADLFQHVAQRLKQGFKSRYRVDFRHGSFNLIIHNGRFVGIEENHKHRAFWVSASQSQSPQQGKVP